MNIELKPLTIENFRAMVDRLIEAANDPDSDLKRDLIEGRHYQNETAKFDVEFARKIGLICSSMEDLIDYVQTRKENR